METEFKAPRDAARIVHIDDSDAGGIEILQPREHGFQCHRPHVFADGGIDGGEWRESGNERLQIKSAAADDERDFAARDDGFDHAECAFGILRGIHILRARDATEEVMRHARLIVRGRLRAEHGEFAVELERVGTDDFAAVRRGEGERDRRFADGGRAGEEDGVAEESAVGHGGRS